jgi:hypothetical protein
MEQNFGGPVWHASVMPRRAVGRAFVEQTAHLALLGAGDAALGEWREWGDAFHIRRRLTDAECALGGCLSVRDLRGSDEGRKRMALLLHDAPFVRPLALRIGELAA